MRARTPGWPPPIPSGERGDPQQCGCGRRAAFTIPRAESNGTVVAWGGGANKQTAIPGLSGVRESRLPRVSVALAAMAPPTITIPPLSVTANVIQRDVRRHRHRHDPLAYQWLR